MQMLSITALDNGAHDNQTYHGVLPEGWALIPDDMELPNFPFGEVVVEGDTVIEWIPGEMPEEEPIEPNEPIASVEERVSTLEETTQQQGEILSILLSGATEAEE